MSTTKTTTKVCQPEMVSATVLLMAGHTDIASRQVSVRDAGGCQPLGAT